MIRPDSKKSQQLSDLASGHASGDCWKKHFSKICNRYIRRASCDPIFLFCISTMLIPKASTCGHNILLSITFGTVTAAISSSKKWGPTNLTSEIPQRTENLALKRGSWCDYFFCAVRSAVALSLLVNISIRRVKVYFEETLLTCVCADKNAIFPMLWKQKGIVTMKFVRLQVVLVLILIKLIIKFMRSFAPPCIYWNNEIMLYRKRYCITSRWRSQILCWERYRQWQETKIYISIAKNTVYITKL